MNLFRRRLSFAVAGLGAGLLTAGCASPATTPPAAPVSDWQSFAAADGTLVHYRRWLPTGKPRSVVQVVHGAAEHSGRYDRFAQALVREGHAVYATDHRGHGRTRLRSGQLGDAGPDGWNRMVDDEIALTQRLRAAHPGVKLTLFGHSLGSFMAQDYITRRPELLDALVLSGTSYGPPPPKPLLDLLETATKANPLAPSEVWVNIFKDFNKPFTGQPGFEWLSRDPAEVAKYMNDPLAGFGFSNELVRDFFVGMAALRDPAREARIPKTLPVLVIQGEKDPVGENLKGTQALLDRLKALGLTRVEHRFYPGARHEVLNETNRGEVQRDVIGWLAKTVG
ncbi:alpha/beta hydrolase [Ideonella sp. BN130291]|uniref:alpha/beta hydrolase n=1 Tax=Ideonella sp. BN130291 TaxID=3112940 RepID=UPI002E261805|nr:lysophospholipase [Ideonella sp. BN130291]